MAIRIKSNTRAIILEQWDCRNGIENARLFIQGGSACFGTVQAINQTGVIYFTDNLGKTHKLTAVMIRRKSCKAGTVHGWISNQLFKGCPVNTDYYLYSIMEPSYSPVAEYPKLTKLSNACIIKAFAKLDRMEVGGGEDLVTMKDTVRLLRNPLSSVAKLGAEMVNSAQRKVHRTRDTVKYYKALSDAISNQWLQYRYGIMPLVYDCRGAMTILEQNLWKWENKLKTVRAVTRYNDSVAHSTTASAGYASSVKCEGTSKISHKCSVCVYYVDKLHMKDARSLEEWGLSPTQLPALAYELIPFSFVADWAFNVGDWLKAIAPHPTIEVKASTLSYKRSIRKNMFVTLTSFQPGSLKSTYSYFADEIERSLNPQIPSHPGMTSQGLSIKRQIDSLALGWSLWPSKKIGTMLASLKTKK